MEPNAETGQLCPPEHFSSFLPGLYMRGLINLKKYSMEGKELMRVYLTQNGINYLAHIDTMHKQPA